MASCRPKGCDILGSLSECVDCIRELPAAMGLRPYRVFLVRRRWSGIERGDGVSTELYRREIKPVLIKGLENINVTRESYGRGHSGSLEITEISTRLWTELDLLPDMTEKEELFYIIQLKDRDLEAFPTKKPVLNITGVPGWSVTVEIR